MPHDNFSGLAGSRSASAALAANTEQLALRAALGSFATGVCVVTARAADGRKVGLTCNSFNSVSLDPPLVLWSLSRRSCILTDFLEARHFAINVLAAGQETLSRRFASPLDRFTGLVCEDGVCGTPLIPGACAHFECAAERAWDGGDHVIFIGRVLRHAHRDDAEPLLYHRREYRVLAKASPARNGRKKAAR